MPSRMAAPPLISVEAAQRIVLEQAAPRDIEEVALPASLNRVLAQDLVAKEDLPPFANSAMDGYALRAADTAGATREQPVTLRVIGEVAAGAAMGRSVRRGEVVTIMTGAPLPPATDSVVMLEQARLREGMVEIAAEVRPGDHVRAAGEDIKAGTIALKAGTRVRVPHLGLLAGLGCARVPVYRRPCVAVLATGSELLSVEAPLTPGKIRNANSIVLTALLAGLGIQAVDLGTAVDDRDVIRERLQAAAARCDVLLICGGVSVGAHDFVKRVLRELGMETLFWRINMKPGKPLLCGRWRDRIVFGLPGNPISCVVGFCEFIAPFLRKAMGEQEPRGGRLQARLTQPLRKKETRTQLFTARLEAVEGLLQATPTPQQGSGMLFSLAQADGFIVMPDRELALDAGSLVEVVPLWGGAWPS